MTEVILGQLRFIVFMMCGGMALMLGYDGLRLLRWLFPHGKLLVAVQDLLYWCAMSVPAFALFFFLHDGQIRWYGLLALLGGITLYEYGISSPVRHALSRRLDPIRYRIRRRIKKIFRWIGKLWKDLIAAIKKAKLPEFHKSENEEKRKSETRQG